MASPQALPIDGGDGGGPLYIRADGQNDVQVPGGNGILKGAFSRLDADLQIDLPDGQQIVVTDYFSVGAVPPSLVTESGARLEGSLTTKLAGPMAPAQVAQAGDESLLGEAVGTVESVKGAVTAIRADGSQVDLGAGDALYENDTLVSSADGSLGIVFADNSTMSMGGSARIVIDEMVYDPDSQSGSQLFDVVQGAFVFASGYIGKSNPEDVQVRTPVATIGIRGTKYAVNVDQDDGEAHVTLFEGAVTVTNDAGQTILTAIGESTSIASIDRPPGSVYVMEPEEQADRYGDAIVIHPTQPKLDLNEDAEDPGGPESLDEAMLEELADQLQDIETAAGPGADLVPISESAAFLRLLNIGFNSEFGISGGLENEVTVSPNGTITFISANDDVFSVAGTAPLAGSEETIQTLSVTNPFVLAGGRYTVTGGNDPGIEDTFVISAADPAAPTNWQIGQDANGNVTISVGDTDISMDGIEALNVTLGDANDTVAIGDLTSTDISNNTITISGGAGDDVLSADGSGRRMVFDGGDGDDVLTGDVGDDELYGGAGDDTINAKLELDEDSRTEIAFGGDGNDTLNVGFSLDDAGNPSFVQGLKALQQAFQEGALSDQSGPMTFDAIDLQVGGIEALTFAGPAILEVLASPTEGTEDTAAALSISVIEALGRALPSDTVITLSGLPENALLTNDAGVLPFNANGTAILTLSDLSGLTIVPPPNSAVDFTIQVSADVASGGAIAASGALTVQIQPDADTPTLSVELSEQISDDTLSGTADADTVIGGGGSDVIEGGAGNDVLYGDGVVQAIDITATLGDLDGSEELLVMLSGVPDGAMLANASGPLTVIDGGVSLSAQDLAGLKITLPPGLEEVFLEVEAFVTDTDPETGEQVTSVVETELALTLETAAAGDDTIAGGSGSDTIVAGAGDDVITETLGGDGGLSQAAGTPDSNSVDGGEGTDKLVLTVAPWDLDVPEIAAELVDLFDFVSSGEAANQTRSYEHLQLTVSGVEAIEIVDFNLLPVDIDGLREPDAIEGSDGNDVLLGSTDDDIIEAGAGNDFVFAMAGDDIANGGDGNDIIQGGLGNDVLSGGDGNDILSGGDGADTLNGDDGNDTVLGHDGDDTMDGGDGNDHLEGGDGNDILVGGGGSDNLYGGDGNDILIADGDDGDLMGGDGDDEIRMDAGLLADPDFDGAGEYPHDKPEVLFDDDLKVSGGDGSDTLRLTGAAPDGLTILGGSLARATDSIETIDVAGIEGAVDLKLSLEDVMSMTDGENVLTIFKDEDDTVSIEGQAVEAGEHVIDGISISIVLDDSEPPPPEG